MPEHLLAWMISALVFSGIVIRPWRLPEYVWAVAGAALLVLTGVVPPHLALAAAARGNDVYLFLIGMMLLSEAARRQGLFDYVADRAVHGARGSANGLFAIVYAVGIAVTVFLSNDATAVVLTPAVYAAARAAKVNPLPYLFSCAFIANAASFVLPIANPANLVVYGEHMPALPVWLARFSLPSLLAIVATFAVLRWSQRHALEVPHRPLTTAPLPLGGGIVAAGIALTAFALLAASTLGLQLGLPTFILGVLVVTVVFIVCRASPLPVLKGVSWGVLPLVAGLFIVVQSLVGTGLLDRVTAAIHGLAASAPAAAPAVVGAVLALGANLINNLPMGLIAASASDAGHLTDTMTGAMLIGVDLGPNLSVTGSLATILWLVALRREGIVVGGWRFLKLGLLVMPPALLLALTALVLQPW